MVRKITPHWKKNTFKKSNTDRQAISSSKIKAVLLDLGNVVLGVDFRRVFAYWARLSNTKEELFLAKWSMDEAYEQHERGEIDFDEYSLHLSNRFKITLSREQWLGGWNQLWTSPIGEVAEALPNIASKYRLYALTNTNEIHADYFNRQYPNTLSNFKKIFISNEIGLRKPEKRCYQYVCEKIELQPQEIFFLDDTKGHVIGARHHHIRAEQVTASQNAVSLLKKFLPL